MSKKKKPDTIRVKFSLSIRNGEFRHSEIIEYDRTTWESYSDSDKKCAMGGFVQEYVDASFEELEG